MLPYMIMRFRTGPSVATIRSLCAAAVTVDHWAYGWVAIMCWPMCGCRGGAHVRSIITVFTLTLLVCMLLTLLPYTFVLFVLPLLALALFTLTNSSYVLARLVISPISIDLFLGVFQ